MLTGLSGSGKTTIGKALVEDIVVNNKSVIFLDGDALREVWSCDNIGYTANDRALNSKRMIKLCHLIEKQGINVVCSFLSIFREDRKWLREKSEDFFLIYLKSNIHALQLRDFKGIYEQDNMGIFKNRNVVGIDIDFTDPIDADLTLESFNPPISINAAVRTITSNGDLYERFI